MHLFKKFNFLFFVPLFMCCKLNAAGSLIRDAETEKFLRELANPIFTAANLNQKNIRIFIVNDDSINAFVSGGQNVFINTGLMRKYNTPDALIGVLAHETGHITSAHIARSAEEMERATNTMLLGYLLGIGALISGAPDAGQAILLGGSQIGERMFLQYTRGQEEAADLKAAQYLKKMHYPASGLIDLLRFFERELIGYQGKIDEYALTHPVSKKRIDFLQKNFPYNFSNKEINQKLQPQMDSVLAKLEGFMENPDYLLKKYQNQNDDRSKYICAIALHRVGKSARGVKLLQELIIKNPSDGFLHELVAQIFYESGKINESIIAYSKAISLLNAQDGATIKIAFALAILTLPIDDKALNSTSVNANLRDISHALQCGDLHSKTDSNIDSFEFCYNLAIKKLKEAQIFESDNPFLFREFAAAYNKIGDEAMSLLSLAEYNFLIGNKEKTQKYAKLAKEKFDDSKNKNTSKPYLTRIGDLLELSKDDKKND